MDNFLTTLKVGLATHLEKQGSSLQELENALAHNEVTKVAELLSSLETTKVAFFGEKLIGDAASGALSFAGNTLKAIPEIGMTSALIAGSLGGAGAYGIHKYMDDEDKEINEKENEVHRIKTLTERLKSDYGIKDRHHG